MRVNPLNRFEIAVGLFYYLFKLFPDDFNVTTAYLYIMYID